MTEREYGRIQDDLVAYYGTKPMTQEQGDFWFERLRRYSAADVWAAVDSIKTDSKYFPTLGDILSRIRSKVGTRYDAPDPDAPPETVLTEAQESFNREFWPVWLRWMAAACGTPRPSPKRRAEMLEALWGEAERLAAKYGVDIDRPEWERIWKTAKTDEEQAKEGE